MRERLSPSPPGRAWIIINADDYGYTPGVSAGIRLAFREGILSSTTAMMNTPSVAEAVEFARRETPAMPIGAHLVLTYGRPLSPPSTVSTLVDVDGRFHSRASLAADPSQAAAEQVHREWRRQIEHLLELGVEVEHLDSHHHIAYLRPDLSEVILDLAAQFGVPVRRAPPGSPADVVKLFAAAKVWTPDVCEGAMMALSTPQTLAAVVDAVPAGMVAEVMTHPGIVDDELRAVSSYAEPREQELATLLDPSLLERLRRSHVELTTFAIACAAAPPREPGAPAVGQGAGVPAVSQGAGVPAVSQGAGVPAVSQGAEGSARLTQNGWPAGSA